MDPMLIVSPKDKLRFSKTGERECLLHLKNSVNTPITYKIQTSSPSKFRVRPRFGVLQQGESVNVAIVLKNHVKLKEGFEKDKFLISAMLAPPNLNGPEDMQMFWKQVPSKSYKMEQHCVCCVYDVSKEPVECLCCQRSKMIDNPIDTIKPCVDVQENQMIIEEKEEDLCQVVKETVENPKNLLEIRMWRTQIMQFIMALMLILITAGCGYLLKKQSEIDIQTEIGCCVQDIRFRLKQDKQNKLTCPQKRWYY
ncbi:motile sperm domain-containing protein 2-like [Teleopsis dalmanni]|uniref:motile sperm domain-containing protein 2-like n=1 Tax=Teleopsis dalmanni TaxID=139649 RepID=UPI000D32C5B9|nr:motile sperm domain-containing protein 2-like [Teleopsis dalmanni]